MAAISGANMYDLLNNDEQHSKKPREVEGPGKPDKSENRRSVPREQKPRGDAGAPSTHQRNRVDDRDRRGGRGGASRGGRGGRGGYGGESSDGVHRNFDRKQGEHSKHAPGEARKHGAVGEVDNTHFSGSAGEFAAQDAAQVADANGDIVGDEILEVTPMAVDPDDAKLTYDEYLAQRNRVDDDINRQTREVTNEGDFNPVKQLVREEVGIFGEALTTKNEEERSAAAGGKKNKKGKISLDEFVGERPAASSSFDSSRGGRGGSRGGFEGRGGSRGGFQGESRGGRGGSDSAPRGGRGGFQGESRRGGFDGQRGGRGGSAPRGGRGGAARAPAANVNLADQSAFPALSPK